MENSTKMGKMIPLEAQPAKIEQTRARQCKLPNESNAGQRALIAAFEAISDLLPPTPSSAWSAWLELGRRAERNLSNLKKLWSWNS